MCYTWSPAYANYFLIETAFTPRKFVFPPLEKNGQAHVAIATLGFVSLAITCKVVISLDQSMRCFMFC